MRRERTRIEAPVVLPGDPPLPEPLAEGLAHHQANRLGPAEEVYESFLQRQPNHPQALAFLGALKARQGRHTEAIQLLRRAIEGNPRLADPRYCLCSLLQAQGRHAEAVTPGSYAAVLGHPRAPKRLQAILKRLGPRERAASATIMANHCLATNRLGEAIEHARQLLRWMPREYGSWALFARCISRIRFQAPVEPALLKEITRLFYVDRIDYRKVVGCALSALAHDPVVAPLLHGMESARDATRFLGDGVRGGEVHALADHELLNRLLRVVVVADIRFERFLTTLRGALLGGIGEEVASFEADGAWLRLVASLAMQAFLNEYVWQVSEPEAAAVEQMTAMVVEGMERGDRPSPAVVAILAAYEPLHRLDCAEDLEAHEWPEELEELMRQQVGEPLEEARLKEEIPTLLPLSGRVSSAVRAQYEENPFPRWVSLPAGGSAVSLSDYIAGILPHLRPEERVQPSHPEILVAGCGTGLIPNHLATVIRNARITAVDLSLSSLAYATRKSRELGIDTIEYVHGDLQNLDRLERKFDHINCFGVLHHMEDILAGWRALEGCLCPGGTMQIGLYSEIAREPVVRMRRHIEARGYRPTVEDMRRCRQDIIDAGDDPAFKVLLEGLSFYTMSEFRDLVFHVQEQRVTLPQVEEMLRELGLDFLGFQHGDPSLAARYRARFPADREMRSLGLWHEFEKENPATFGNCYNFWVRKPV